MFPTLLSTLQSLPPEAVEACTLLVSFASPLILARLFGAAGLYVHIAVAIVAANIQVMKQAQFGFLPEPVALGTAIFASTYLAGDMLTELYGPAAGRRGVYIGFASYFVFTLLMILTLGYRPIEGDGQQAHLAAIFLPAPALFAAGMISYLISELNDVWVFQRLKRCTEGRKLWLRTNVSGYISALLDNIVFSTLAWVVFAETPIGAHELIYTYILGTYVLRVAYTVIETPFMYAARAANPNALTPAFETDKRI